MDATNLTRSDMTEEDAERMRRISARISEAMGFTASREPRWRYFQKRGGPMFFWTTERYEEDSGHEWAGKYVSGVYKPVGPGARTGKAERFELTKEVGHRTRKAAKARALRLFEKG